MSKNMPGDEVPADAQPSPTDTPPAAGKPPGTDAPSTNGAPHAPPPPRRGRKRRARARTPRDGGKASRPAPLSFRERYAAPAALVRQALEHSARSLRANLGAYLLGAALWLIPFFYVNSSVLVVNVGGGFAAGGGLHFGVLALQFLVMAVYVTFIQTGFVNAALRVEAGEKLRVGDFFKVPRRGKALATSLLVTIALAVGLLLWVLPGLLIGVWTIFAVAIAMDRGLGPIAAIKASFGLIGKDPVAAMLLGLVVGLLIALGLALFYLPGLALLLIYSPILVAAPIVGQGVVHLYRKFEELPAP